MLELSGIPTRADLPDGYYLRRHKKWNANIPSGIETVQDGKVRGTQPVIESIRHGFVYERVYVYTGRQIDEILLEAYIAGSEGKAFDPLVLLDARKDNSHEHRTQLRDS